MVRYTVPSCPTALAMSTVPLDCRPISREKSFAMSHMDATPAATAPAAEMTPPATAIPFRMKPVRPNIRRNPMTPWSVSILKLASESV